QSGIFTQAMAGNRRRPKSSTLEHPQGGYADREQRGLCVFGQVQLFWGAFKAQAGQVLTEDLSGLREQGARFSLLVVKGLSPPDGLGSLARKDPRKKRFHRVQI